MLRLLPLLAFLLAVDATAQPTFVVEPYLQFGTQTSMVVMWETPEAATSRVEYGESRFGDETPNLSQHVALDGTRTMHEVILSDLQPETKYFWRVVSTLANGETMTNDASTFRTAVHDSSAFAFLLYGDTQNNPAVWGRLAELGWLERPNFALHAGDLVDRGGNLEDWLVDFFPPGNVLMERIPLYTVLGNHEDDDPHYYRYMHNPAPEYYYTFSYGNAQFFMLDTNRDVAPGSEQYEWLEWQLAQSTATWKVVVHHHPPYSSEENDHGDSWTGSTTHGTHARNLVPLYEQYGVDFCLFGHVHMYERTWPILQGEVNQKNGVIYINSGGGGGGLEQFAPTRSWFSAKVKSTHHYAYFAIHDQTLFFQAIDDQGRLFDHFQLRKDTAYDPEASAQVLVPPPPRIRPDGGLFLAEGDVTLTAALEDLAIHYTLDGTEPTVSSPRYTAPIRLSDSATLRTRTFAADGTLSRVKTAAFERTTPRPAITSASRRLGLRYAYYEGAWKQLPDFSTLSVVDEGSTQAFDLEALKQTDDGYGLVFEGYLRVPTTGVYRFEVRSDDGTKLFLGGDLLINNDGSHSALTRYGQAALEAGLHAFRLEYFEDHGGETLSVRWAGPGIEMQPLPSTALAH
ncbi:MAG: hypothetical protein RhofKO_10880 [Rhodothermales bacterium]